jgi:hypothetical protein
MSSNTVGAIVYGVVLVMNDDGRGINVTFMYTIAKLAAQEINMYFL